MLTVLPMKLVAGTAAKHAEFAPSTSPLRHSDHVCPLSRETKINLDVLRAPDYQDYLGRG